MTAQSSRLAVLARDTGRVLLVQRSIRSHTEPGKWEFPGGKPEGTESSIEAASREWEEETGARLPNGKLLGEFNVGRHHIFTFSVSSEAKVRIRAPRGEVDAIAWWSPSDAAGAEAVRIELRDRTTWDLLKRR